jgi:hypothetical protein
MDEAVDQVMGRSSDEKGAEKAVAIRRGQQKERARLQSEITSEQKIVATLNEERAPIAAEVRKVEAEVGPIKYIAALLYGDNPDQNILDKAVTWVIILIVIVFDPLAVSLLMAAQFSLEQSKPKPRLTDEDGQLTSDFFKEMVPATTVSKKSEEPEPAPVIIHPENIDNEDADNDIIIVKEPVVEYAYLNTEKSFWEKHEGWVDVPPQVYKPEEPVVVVEETIVETKPQKEIVIMNNEYISIDGQSVYYNSMGGGDSSVKNATDLANKLLATGKYYMITHTADSIIISDEKGTTTTVQVEAEGPTYVQNEEQQVSGLWQSIKNNITEEEYIEKSKKAQEKKDQS